MLEQVLDDDGGLGQDDGLGGAGRRDVHDGGLAERVELLELVARQVRLRVPVEDLEVVGELELLEEPEDALGAGLVEPGGFGGVSSN